MMVDRIWPLSTTPRSTTDRSVKTSMWRCRRSKIWHKKVRCLSLLCPKWPFSKVLNGQ